MQVTRYLDGRPVTRAALCAAADQSDLFRREVRRVRARLSCGEGTTPDRAAGTAPHPEAKR